MDWLDTPQDAVDAAAAPGDVSAHWVGIGHVHSSGQYSDAGARERVGQSGGVKEVESGANGGQDGEESIGAAEWCGRDVARTSVGRRVCEERGYLIS